MTPKQPLHNPRITILGGGPIALEAALYGRTLGYPVSLLEQGSLGQQIRDWGHVRLFTPWSMNTTTLGRRRLEETGHLLPAQEHCPTGHEFLKKYLLPLSLLPEMDGVVSENTQVAAVTKTGLFKGTNPGSHTRGDVPFRILIRRENRESMIQSDLLVDASGVYGQPNPLGPGGIPAPGEREAKPFIRTGVPRVEAEEVKGKDVMVVGSGMSAATTLSALGNLEPRSVTWVTLHGLIPEVPSDPLPERVSLTRAANTFGAGEGVDHLPGHTITELERAGERIQVALTSGDSGASTTREVDLIFNQTGFRPDLDLLRELQIHTCFASEGPMKLATALLGDSGTDCMDQAGHGADTLRNPEPNCFVIGSKSYGRNSNFLLRVGHDQVRDMYQIITGDSTVDLYSSTTMTAP